MSEIKLGASKAQKPDYGIDAPGVRKGMFIAGVSGLVLLVLGLSFNIVWLLGISLLVASYGLFMAGYMTYASRVGKLHTRERLLDLVEISRPWQGSEAVLDVGCGRGLMMVGAAKRLDVRLQGIAVGIDLWSNVDQAENSPEATMLNARIEGVDERVHIDTGDARALPYPDASFDVLLSHWVVHNIESAEERLKILDEMLRVLRHGGVIAMADIAFAAQYLEHFKLRKVNHMQFLDGGVEAKIMGILSGNSFCPQALLIRK